MSEFEYDCEIRYLKKYNDQMRREGEKKKRKGTVPAMLKAAPVTVCSAAHFLGMLVNTILW